MKRNKKDNIRFSWNEKDGISVCVLIDNKGREWVGRAICHSADRDMISEKTGYEISSRKAEIKLFEQHLKDLRFEKKALSDLLSTYKSNPKYEEDSWSVRILKKKIWGLSDDISEFKKIISVRRKELEDIIAEKEAFYQKVRARRHKNDMENEGESN